MSTGVYGTSILNTSGTDATGAWFTTGNADKIYFFIKITGAATVELELDHVGDASDVVSLGTFTSSDQRVLDDPVGNVRAKSTGVGGGESASVRIYRAHMRGDGSLIAGIDD